MHDNRNDVVAADYPIILYDGLMDNIASKNDFRTVRAVLECFYVVVKHILTPKTKKSQI